MVDDEGRIAHVWVPAVAGPGWRPMGIPSHTPICANSVDSFGVDKRIGLHLGIEDY